MDRCRSYVAQTGTVVISGPSTHSWRSTRIARNAGPLLATYGHADRFGHGLGARVSSSSWGVVEWRLPGGAVRAVLGILGGGWVSGLGVFAGLLARGLRLGCADEGESAGAVELV
jgi:hypothetical protein